MKKVLLGLILLSLSGVALADTQAYNLSKEAQAKIEAENQEKESLESLMDKAIHRGALMADVKINCSSAGQSKVQELVSTFDGELRKEYEGLFSCEAAIGDALNGGILESEIREELEL